MRSIRYITIYVFVFLLFAACGAERGGTPKGEIGDTGGAGDTGEEASCAYGNPYLTLDEYVADMVALYCSVAVRCHTVSLSYDECVASESTTRFTEEHCKWEGSFGCEARECIEKWTELNHQQTTEDPDCIEGGLIPGVCFQVEHDMDCDEPDM
jgi:hypothetical protein